MKSYLNILNQTTYCAASNTDFEKEDHAPLICWSPLKIGLDDGYGLDLTTGKPWHRTAWKAFSKAKFVWNKCEAPEMDQELKNFLPSGMTQVGVRGTFSNQRPVISGVLQGKVIEPLFFLYLSEILTIVKNKMRMFADDRNIWDKIGSCISY